jgi:hypothetical protein
MQLLSEGSPQSFEFELRGQAFSAAGRYGCSFASSDLSCRRNVRFFWMNRIPISTASAFLDQFIFVVVCSRLMGSAGSSTCLQAAKIVQLVQEMQSVSASSLSPINCQQTIDILQQCSQSCRQSYFLMLHLRFVIFLQPSPARTRPSNSCSKSSGRCLLVR